MTSTEAQNGYLNRLCVFYDHSWEQVALNIIKGMSFGVKST